MPQYITKQAAQAGTTFITVTACSPGKTTPPVGQKYDLNTWKCTVTTTNTVPSDNTFPTGQIYTVDSMSLYSGKVGSTPTMGFTAKGDQPVQVGSGDVEDE